jgi:hypothetical protein
MLEIKYVDLEITNEGAYEHDKQVVTQRKLELNSQIQALSLLPESARDTLSYGQDYLDISTDIDELSSNPAFEEGGVLEVARLRPPTEVGWAAISAWIDAEYAKRREAAEAAEREHERAVQKQELERKRLADETMIAQNEALRVEAEKARIAQEQAVRELQRIKWQLNAMNNRNRG